MHFITFFMALQSHMKEKISKTFLLMHKTLMSVCGRISVINEDFLVFPTTPIFYRI